MTKHDNCIKDMERRKGKREAFLDIILSGRRARHTDGVVCGYD